MKIDWHHESKLLRQRQTQKRQYSLINFLQKINIKILKNRINGKTIEDKILLERYDLIEFETMQSYFCIYIQNNQLFAKEILKNKTEQ